MSNSTSNLQSRKLSSRDNVSFLLDAVREHYDTGEFHPAQLNHALAVAYKVALCNDNSNCWRGSDVVNFETGECFEAEGKLFRCNNRLCFDCLAAFQRRNRQKIRRLMTESKLKVGTDYRLITFTIKNQNLPLQESRELINRTWQLFRKRHYFKQIFHSGVKCEEFTFTSQGYHYHLHLIAQTKYILYSLLRAEWTRCYLKAAEEFDVDTSISTSDGLLVVNAKKIYDLKSSVFEVTKYVTKSESWQSIPAEDLIEYALIKRHPRMTEFFGGWRHAHNTPLPDEEREPEFPEDVHNKTIVHKENLFDGSFVKFEPLHSILEIIEQKSVEVSQFRLKQIRWKQPQASLSYKKSDGYAARIREACLKLEPSQFDAAAIAEFNRHAPEGVQFSTYKP